MFTGVNILIKKRHFKLFFFYTIIYNKEKFTTIYNQFFTVFFAIKTAKMIKQK